MELNVINLYVLTKYRNLALKLPTYDGVIRIPSVD